MQDTNEASLNLNHSVNLLKKLGLPANTAVTVTSGSHSNGSYFYMFNTSAGHQMVRVLNCFSSGISHKILNWDSNNRVNVSQKISDRRRNKEALCWSA